MASSSSVGRWISKNIWMSEEDLAKKNDDFKLPHHTGSNWQAARTPRRKALVRYVVYALACLFAIFFVRRLTHAREEDIVRPYSQYRYHDTATAGLPTQVTKPKPPTTKTPTIKATPAAEPVEAFEPAEADTDKAAATDGRHFKGVLKFSSLLASLRQLTLIRTSNNVLFSASSLESAATLLPMACQRAISQKADHVYFALFGDSDIKLEKLLKLNGVDESCKIMTFDARADQRQQLTRQRLALAAARALSYINSFTYPSVVIVDGSSAEDRPFLDGIRDQMSDMSRAALIVLPDRAQSRLSWISQLDAAALFEWNHVHFDIVIHAPPTGTGNLKRLLRSLAAADLSGHAIPQITVELPPTIDISLERFLNSFQWPEPRFASSSPNMLTLRHRVLHERASANESAVRLLESFWPKNAQNSHVLILSPHTEVSWQFFHYVKYSLLHRRYGKVESLDDPYSLMFGLSFTVPETNLHNTKPFTAPLLPLERMEAPGKGSTSFAWQAPCSDALLVFGDKWVELHGYISQSLETQRRGAAVPALTQSREVAENKPAWLEHMLQLCRLRGYFTVYPSQETADAVVGVYADLPDIPDGREKSDDVESRLKAHRGSSFDAGSQVDILNTLPNGGGLQGLQSLPFLSWEGETSTFKEMVQHAYKLTAEFRREIGTCEDPAAVVKRDRSARDLFCVGKPDMVAS